MSGRIASPRRGLWRAFAVLPFAALLALTGCSDNDNKKKSSEDSTDFINAPSTGPTATIRRTTSGVPHILADNLESVTFGSGYAQAQDNVCLIADGIVKARSERSLYFGPGPGSVNIINDFSYKALGMRTGAEAEYAAMSPASRAMLRGFVAGYNKYVRETSPATFPTECRNGPWVKVIDEIDLLAYYRSVTATYSGDYLASVGVLFAAAPPGVDPRPVPVAPTVASREVRKLIDDTIKFARLNAAERKNYTDIGLASNAWGVGADLTENGRGVLLANPHFPYTGLKRLYEMQVTVPGYIDFHGAGLMGTPIPLIGFNRHVGWSHTVSTNKEFTVYELTLKSGDPLTYIKDGVEKPITSRRFTIQVNVGAPQPVTFQKDFYYTEYGLMLPINLMTGGALPAWGSGPSPLTGCASCAHTYRDANPDTRGFLDTFLGMGRAQNLAQFQQVFRNCGTTLWVNSTYADDQGNAFYMDTSSAPNLSSDAMRVLMAKYYGSASFKQLFDGGLAILDGSTSRDDWVQGQCDGLVPYEGRPKLLRNDFVQNSNDSYWATNPASPVEGYSPMFGIERTAQAPRTRIGLTMLQNPTLAGFGAAPPAGQDGKFGAEDIATVLHNNRAWYAEEFLGELRQRCSKIGNGLVNLAGGGQRSVASGCAALALGSWNGRFDLDSVGAHVFRVFMADYSSKLATDLTVPFNAADPVGTPSTPRPEVDDNLANDPMLTSLAAGLQRLDSASVAYNATLGTVQVFQPTGGVPPGGTAVTLGPSFPWHGGHGDIEGAFNAVRTANSSVQQDTLLPRINCATVATTGGLCSTPGLGWQIAYGTSWHFGLEFTSDGPRALGLISYSQSTNPASPFFNDQSQRYSEKNMREIPFSESEIEAALLPGGEITITDD